MTTSHTTPRKARTPLQKAERKIARLEYRVAYLEAENEVYQMMIHDIALPSIVAAVKAKWPKIAKDLERE